MTWRVHAGGAAVGARAAGGGLRRGAGCWAASGALATTLRIQASRFEVSPRPTSKHPRCHCSQIVPPSFAPFRPPAAFAPPSHAPGHSAHLQVAAAPTRRRGRAPIAVKRAAAPNAAEPARRISLHRAQTPLPPAAQRPPTAMTVSAEDAAFSQAGPQHLDVIVANNIAMAKETENVDLPPAVAHKGVQAVLHGEHGAQVSLLYML